MPAFVALAALLFPSLVFAYTPNDPLFPQQYYLQKISAPAAWDITRGSPSVIVAVIDSGVDLSNPDLKNQIWTNPNVGQDGYVNDLHGWDFTNNTNDPEPDLSQGWLEGGVDHGTVVAGIIAAQGDNGQGIAGIAWNVKIMPLRVVDSFGQGDSANVVPAIRYAVDHGAKVINMSFTSTTPDPALDAEIERAYHLGVVIVAAAGNSDTGDNLTDTPEYPACLRNGADHPVIGVAATDQNDARASFSNFGNGCVDIAAPGVNIFSTSLYRPNEGDFTSPYSGGWSGTSFSTPMVVGAAALLLSAHPTLTPDQVREILQLSADPILSTDGAPTGSVGVGRLDIANALAIAGSFDGTGPEVPLVNAPSATTSTGDTTRSIINATLPASAPIDSLIKLANQSTVYYVGLDGKRHPFPNADIFHTWFTDATPVQTLSVTDMAAIPLGQPVLVRPGTDWIKIASDPKTYFVEPDGYTLRWIKDEATAEALGGANWNKHVLDIDPTFFSKFQQGPDIDETTLATQWPSGALVSAPGSTTVWYMQNNTRRQVTSLAANNFQVSFVQTIAGSWQTLPIGAPISSREDDLFSDQLLVE